MENFRNASDEELLAAAREIAEEAERRGLRLSRSLGELAGSATAKAAEYDDDEADPFLKPGSLAAKKYARERDQSGRPRWMRPFSRTDLFGRPTVFSDAYDPTDRGI